MVVMMMMMNIRRWFVSGWPHPVWQVSSYWRLSKCPGIPVIHDGIKGYYSTTGVRAGGMVVTTPLVTILRKSWNLRYEFQQAEWQAFCTKDPLHFFRAIIWAPGVPLGLVDLYQCQQLSEGLCWWVGSNLLNTVFFSIYICIIITVCRMYVGTYGHTGSCTWFKIDLICSDKNRHEQHRRLLG